MAAGPRSARPRASPRRSAGVTTARRRGVFGCRFQPRGKRTQNSVLTLFQCDYGFLTQRWFTLPGVLCEVVSPWERPEQASRVQQTQELVDKKHRLCHPCHAGQSVCRGGYASDPTMQKDRCPVMHQEKSLMGLGSVWTQIFERGLLLLSLLGKLC